MLAAQGSVRFAQQAWNFGSIKESAGKVSHCFEFVNAGKTPIVIEKVTVSCGCTTSDYDQKPVRPGAKGRLTISYHPAGRPGPFRRDAEVAFSGSQRVVLTLSGRVEESLDDAGRQYPVQIGGLRVAMARVHMGYVPRGAVVSRAIEFFNASTNPLNVNVVKLSPRSIFDVDAVPLRVASGAKGALTISYDLRNSNVWGELCDRFRVVVNGVSSDTVFVVTGVATEDFDSMTPTQKAEAPQALFSSQYYGFGVQKRDVVLKRTFTLTNEGHTPLIIRDMKLDREVQTSLDAKRPIGPGESVTFTMSVSTSALAEGKIMRRMVLIVNDPSRPLREIRLAATLTR